MRSIGAFFEGIVTVFAQADVFAREYILKMGGYAYYYGGRPGYLAGNAAGIGGHDAPKA